MQTVVKHALINAASTAIYVVLVASFLYYAPNVFGRVNTVLIPIAMLLLFVFSAAFTGALLFGRPALWYLEGKKSEALSLLFATLGVFFAITLSAMLCLLFFVGR